MKQEKTEKTKLKEGRKWQKKKYSMLSYLPLLNGPCKKWKSQVLMERREGGGKTRGGGEKDIHTELCSSIIHDTSQ